MNAQLIKLSDVKEVKKATLLIGLSGNDKQDAFLQKAISKFWTFSEVDEALPKYEALEKAKGNPDIFVVSVGRTNSSSRSHNSADNTSTYKYVASGTHLEIRNGRKPAIKQFMPTFGENEKELTEEIFASTLSSISYICETLIKNSMKSNVRYKSAYKEHSSKLKSKTLYIAEGWVDPKLKGEVSDIYSGKVKVVSYNEWRNVILSQKKGAAYSIIIPNLGGSEVVYQHYLMDAQTGMVFAIPNGNAVSISGMNVSKSNNGYVNKKMLKKYNNVLKGKW